MSCHIWSKLAFLCEINVVMFKVASINFKIQIWNSSLLHMKEWIFDLQRRLCAIMGTEVESTALLG